METCDIQAQRNAFPWRWNWKIGSVPFTQTSPTLLSTASPSGTRTSLSQAYNLCFCSFFYLRIQLHNIAPHQCVSCLSSWRYRLKLKTRCLPSCLDPNKMTSQDQRQRKKSCVFCSRDFLAERLEGDKFCSKNTELLNALSPRIFIVLLKNLAEICFS